MSEIDRPFLACSPLLAVPVYVILVALSAEPHSLAGGLLYVGPIALLVCYCITFFTEELEFVAQSVTVGVAMHTLAYLFFGLWMTLFIPAYHKIHKTSEFTASVGILFAGMVCLLLVLIAALICIASEVVKKVWGVSER